MLDVTYEAVIDLAPGKLAEIDEDRGQIRIRLDKYEPLASVVAQLNLEIDQLMASAHWFQLWKDEIVSCNTPDRPLRVEFVLDERTPDAVGIFEDRGIVKVFVRPDLTTQAFAAAMNPAVRDFLAGGQWFQLFAGEIIDNGPERVSKV